MLAREYPAPESGLVAQRLGADPSPWVDRFEAISAWKLVAVSRFALALFALIAVYLDPTQPARSAETVYKVLVTYVVYTGLLVFVPTHLIVRFRAAVIVHAVDIAVFGVVIHLTQGPTSPFFIFLTFALFSATLHWGWKGAVFTTAATVTIFGSLAILAEDTASDLNRVVMRGAYLFVAGILFAYFGTIIEAMRLHVATLAGSTTHLPPDGAHPPIEPILRQSAKILRAARVFVAWENDAAPPIRTAEFDGHRVIFSDSPVTPGMQAGGDHRASLWDLKTASRLIPGLAIEGTRTPNAIAVPISGIALRGCVYFLDCEETGDNLMPVASVAAVRIGSEIAQDNLRRKLVEAAKAEEREFLARDIHDDLMQGLTAVSFQLAALEKQNGRERAERIAHLRSVVGDQQAKLRALVRNATTVHSSPHMLEVAENLPRILDELRSQWHCTASLTVRPATLAVGERIFRGIAMVLSESIANGVRHGGATHFETHLEASRTLFTLSIRDNGSGLPEMKGRFEHERVFADELGSLSLRERVRVLGWRLTLENSPGGLEVVVRGAIE